MKPQPREPDWADLLRRENPPAPDPAAAAHTVELLRTLPPPRPTGWAFVRTQAGFIRKRMWALQFAVLAGVLALVAAAGSDGVYALRQYALCAAAAPLLLVANVQDLARVYHSGMLELELATRYSLPRVTAARLLVFGLCDGALLGVLAAVGAIISRTDLWVVLLYCVTPFCCVSAVCMVLLRHLRPSVFSKAALAVAAAALGVLVLPFDWLQSHLYGLDARPFWAAALAVSLAVLVQQSRRLTRDGVPTTL